MSQGAVSVGLRARCVLRSASGQAYAATGSATRFVPINAVMIRSITGTTVTIIAAGAISACTGTIDTRV